MAEDTAVTDLLEQPVERAAREIALRLLDKVEKERRRLDEPDDVEALHDFRVAVRRLRSWLRAFRESLRGGVSGKHRDALRAVARATNAGRDAEVHVEWLRARAEFFRGRRRRGTEWLIERLQLKRLAGAHALRDALDRDFVPVRRKLAAQLEVYSRPVRPGRPEQSLAHATALLVREQADDLRKKVAAVRAPADQQAAHAARIAAKHLRYLLEPVGSEVTRAEAVVERLEQLQDVLGALHDAHVFGTEVTGAMVAAASDQAHKLSTTVLEGDPGRRSVRRAKQDAVRPGLLAIAHRLRAGLDESFSSFSAAWSGEAADEFWDDVDLAAASLRARAPGSTEIERKYLLSGVPREVRSAQTLEIEQGYLPGERLVERVRRVADRRSTRWYRTVKLGHGIARVEIEEETTRAVFDRMWTLTKGRRLKKRRRRVPVGTLTWEIDEFTDRKLVLAEVELPTRDAAVEIPEWLQPHLVREVTEDEEYENARLGR
ncbi:MAG TPA: CHAD domain-containing protein [Vicinamibacteria bacterium]|jgi:CHAD domain-containing protein/CYTH domain-containing protein